MVMRKIKYVCGGWKIFDDGCYVGSLQRTHGGKYWTFTIKGQSRTLDNFSDARAYAYNF